MRRWLTICAVALLAVATTGWAQQQEDSPSIESYSFDFTGGGARAEGMGKAFIAVSDDITAGSWNPAGLYIQEQPILGVSYGSLSPRGNTRTTLGLQTYQFNHGGSFGNITSFNLLAPVRIKGHHFVGSFNFTRNFDEFQGVSFSQQGERDSSVLGIPIYHILDNTSTAAEIQGGLNSVNVGFGTRLYENVSFGASVNIYTGEAVKDVKAIVNSDFVPIKTEVALRELQVTTVDFIDTNKFSGYNFTVGFKLEGEKLDAGLVVRSPFSLNVKTGRSIYVVTTRGAPGAQMLVSFGDTTYYDNLLAKYDMPLSVGAGLAYQATENLLLAMDMEFRAFGGSKINSRYSLIIDPGGDNEELFNVIDPEWKNVFLARFGGEYLRQTGIGVIPVRAGFGYVPLPEPNRDSFGKATSSVTSFTVSLGSGIHWNQIHLDWAYTFTSANWELGTSEQKSRNHHLNFTFTGYF